MYLEDSFLYKYIHKTIQYGGCFIYDFDTNNYYILYIVDGNIDNHVLRLFMNYIELKYFGNYIVLKKLAMISKQLSEDPDERIIKLK